MLEQAPSQSNPQGTQAPPSLNERIGNIFGGQPKPQPQQQQQAKPQQAPEPEAPEVIDAADPADTSEVQEAGDANAPAEETFEFEVEGEKYVLPKKLEKSVLQERDYTQKAQSLADQRRLVEIKEQQSHVRELQSKFQSEVANEMRQIQLIDAVLEQPVNWQTMSNEEAFRHKIQLDDLKQQKEKLQQAIDQKQQGFKQQQADAEKALLQKTAEALKSLIPGWGPEIAKEVTQHFYERGWSEADFKHANSRPDLIQTAWEAMQYRKLQAKAKPAVQAAKTVKATSANPMPQATKEYLSYRKTIQRTAPNSPERRKVVTDRIAKMFSR